jgi:hypothetical protein
LRVFHHFETERRLATATISQKEQSRDIYGNPQRVYSVTPVAVEAKTDSGHQ